MLNNDDNVADVINSTLLNIKEILDVNASVGKPIKVGDNSFVIPVTKINVGCLSGGAKVNKVDKKKVNEIPFSGGSGTGFSIIPIGFICILNNSIKYVNCNQETSIVEDMVNVINKSFSKIVLKEEKNDK